MSLHPSSDSELVQCRCIYLAPGFSASARSQKRNTEALYVRACADLPCVGTKHMHSLVDDLKVSYSTLSLFKSLKWSSMALLFIEKIRMLYKI